MENPDNAVAEIDLLPAHGHPVESCLFVLFVAILPGGRLQRCEAVGLIGVV